MADLGGFSVPKCPQKDDKYEQILKVMKLTFDIIYSKIMALVYPPGPQGGSKFRPFFNLKSFSKRTALFSLKFGCSLREM